LQADRASITAPRAVLKVVVGAFPVATAQKAMASLRSSYRGDPVPREAQIIVGKH
jgi:hypothetical protein